MKKIDYISLSRHFSGEATDAENCEVFRWKDSSNTNKRAYERLLALYDINKKSSNNIDSQYEVFVWRKIIGKVLSE
ncbi:hypothetical protein VB264_13430 [Arcicella aquatica]|uniref:Uncharacterized protein n=1 Tax=Arcicella aquatica TaxID=217141 RepID=A0ABU5QNX5_9BACT|nr:hypothetical protein [Arcicella aquatica]MEA5258792.1 hypothetical protein [Arcicella aquatica]